jgi:hypothetical protein
VNFVRAMYRPTKFFWRRLGSAPDLFSFQPRSENESVPVRPGMTTASRRRQVNQFLTTLQPVQTGGETSDPLDMFGKDMTGFDELFNSISAARDVVPSEEVTVKPNLRVRSRPLKEQVVEPAIHDSEVQTIQVEQPRPQIESKIDEFLEQQTHAKAEVPHETGQSALKEVGIVKNVQTAEEKHIENSAPMTVATTTPQAFVESSGDQAQAASSQDGLTPVTFNRALPFPSLPDKPNILIGMVYNQAGSIVPNAILEIINDQGNTVRALKTNSLGQFYTSTPLPAGNYIIETELEGFSFPRLSLVATDQILDPIEIRPNSQA